LRAIGPNIANGNTMIFGGVKIDIIDTGCCESDEAQASGIRYDVFRHTDLVGENEVYALDSFWHEIRWRAVECMEVRYYFRQWRRIEFCRAHGSEVEKNCFHGFSVILWKMRVNDDG
jgi:hypothetical protein